jgi:hypothetical protein
MLSQGRLAEMPVVRADIGCDASAWARSDRGHNAPHAPAI